MINQLLPLNNAPSRADCSKQCRKEEYLGVVSDGSIPRILARTTSSGYTERDDKQPAQAAAKTFTCSGNETPVDEAEFSVVNLSCTSLYKEKYIPLFTIEVTADGTYPAYKSSRPR
jgi:hypothetical protein